MSEDESPAGGRADDADDVEDAEEGAPLSPDAVVEQALARLELGRDAEGEHAALAHDALWLALVSLGEEVRPELEALLAGEVWSPLLGPEAPPLRDPLLDRVALGLIAQRHAARAGAGVAQRAAAALAAAALCCADPRVGLRLQPGFGRLRLLEIVEQIPVALPIRALTLELRHLPLRTEPRVPPALIARVEDLLDRLDAQGLLPASLADHPDAADVEAPGWTSDALLAALLPGRARALRSLARVVLPAPAPFTDAEALLAACRAADPRLWADAAPEVVLRRYAALAEALGETPFALRPASEGFGRS